MGIREYIAHFLEILPLLTRDETNLIEAVIEWDGEQKAAFTFAKKQFEENMDKKIRKIEKEVKKHQDKKASKDLKTLEKEDKKRDKFVEAGKKALAKKKK